METTNLFHKYKYRCIFSCLPKSVNFTCFSIKKYFNGEMVSYFSTTLDNRAKLSTMLCSNTQLILCKRYMLSRKDLLNHFKTSILNMTIRKSSFFCADIKDINGSKQNTTEYIQTSNILKSSTFQAKKKSIIHPTIFERSCKTKCSIKNRLCKQKNCADPDVYCSLDKKYHSNPSFKDRKMTRVYSIGHTTHGNPKNPETKVRTFPLSIKDLDRKPKMMSLVLTKPLPANALNESINMQRTSYVQTPKIT